MVYRACKEEGLWILVSQWIVDCPEEIKKKKKKEQKGDVGRGRKFTAEIAE